MLRTALASVILLASVPAFAGEPAALVLDISGEVSPQIEAFDELIAGTEIALGAGGMLVLSHYGSCEEITQTGGTITIGSKDVRSSNATSLERQRGDCPEEVDLVVDNAENSGLIMRNLGNLPAVGLAPEIVVAGASQSDYSAMQLARGDSIIATLQITNGRVEWPKGSLFLSNRTKYVLRLIGTSENFAAEVIADRSVNGRVILRP